MTAALPPHSQAPVPAFVLALALLAGLAVTGYRAADWMRVAPSTPVPAQALDDSRHRPVGEPGTQPLLEAGPGWGDLTTAQKEVLYPLANRWSVLSEVQKRHWLKLAAGFPELGPADQARVVARLTDWASLSTRQRSQARLNYAASTALAPDDKRAKWEAYQSLSEDERQRLLAKAAPRPAGAATPVQPSPAKLARVPAATEAPVVVANPPKIPRPSAAHVPQALPVHVFPAPAPVPPRTDAEPAPVESRPVGAPTAQGTPLPPLPVEEPAAPREPASGDNAAPAFLPQ